MARLLCLCFVLTTLFFSHHPWPTDACSCAYPTSLSRVLCFSQFAALVQIKSGPVRLLSNDSTLQAAQPVDPSADLWTLLGTVSNKQPQSLPTASSHTSLPIGSPAKVIALKDFSQISSPAVKSRIRSAFTSRRSVSLNLESAPTSENQPITKKLVKDFDVVSIFDNPNRESVQSDQVIQIPDQLVSTFYRAQVLHIFKMTDKMRARLQKQDQQIRLWTEYLERIGPMTSCHMGKLFKDKQYLITSGFDDSGEHVVLHFCGTTPIEWMDQPLRNQLQHIITTGLRCR